VLRVKCTKTYIDRRVQSQDQFGFKLDPSDLIAHRTEKFIVGLKLQVLSCVLQTNDNYS